MNTLRSRGKNKATQQQQRNRGLAGCSGPGRAAGQCGADVGGPVKQDCCVGLECQGSVCVSDSSGSNCKVSATTNIVIMLAEVSTPRIVVPAPAPTPPSPTGGNPLLIDFEDGTLGPFVVSGGANNPWELDANASCGGSVGVTAGLPGGVDRESFLTMTVPAGVSTVEYIYSYPSALDSGETFMLL